MKDRHRSREEVAVALLGGRAAARSHHQARPSPQGRHDLSFLFPEDTFPEIPEDVRHRRARLRLDERVGVRVFPAQPICKDPADR